MNSLPNSVKPLPQHEGVFQISHCPLPNPWNGNAEQQLGQYVPNPHLKLLRKTNCVLNVILLISSVIVTIVYVVLWVTLISPSLDLRETGNWFAFLLLFISCGVIFLMTSYTVHQHSIGAPVTFGYVFKCIVILAMCVGGLCTLYLGAAETSKGKFDKKAKTTYFGAYIAKVCHPTTDDALQLIEDAAKCDATKRLKTIIYSMYAWVAEIILVIFLDFILGLSNLAHKDAPEMIFIPYAQESQV